MYEVRHIQDSDTYTLLELHYKLQQLLPDKLNKSQSAWILLNEINKQTRLILGLFKNDVLSGFINGYEENSEVFHFSNLYINPDSRYGIRKLMLEAENWVKKHNYKVWTSNSILKEGKQALIGFGAKEI